MAGQVSSPASSAMRFSGSYQPGATPSSPVPALPRVSTGDLTSISCQRALASQCRQAQDVSWGLRWDGGLHLVHPLTGILTTVGSCSSQLAGTKVGEPEWSPFRPTRHTWGDPRVDGEVHIYKHGQLTSSTWTHTHTGAHGGHSQRQQLES